VTPERVKLDSSGFGPVLVPIPEVPALSGFPLAFQGVTVLGPSVRTANVVEFLLVPCACTSPAATE
jgi:hypothetical protein